MHCLGAKCTGKELYVTVSGYGRAKHLHQDQKLPGLITAVYCSSAEDSIDRVSMLIAVIVGFDGIVVIELCHSCNEWRIRWQNNHFLLLTFHQACANALLFSIDFDRAIVK